MDHPGDFKEFIERVPEHAPAPVEATIFSIGGRGYYENPTSDVLAFYMDPGKDHGLGSMFLDAFLECLGPIAGGDTPPVLGTGLEVRREVRVEGGRLDLVLSGDAGVLLIENKVFHHAEGNPFSIYEKYGQDIRGERLLHRAILSPHGGSAPGDWQGVSYQAYCTKLEERLANPPDDGPPLKWWVLAKDFILHLRTTLYSITMTAEQIEFAEKHAHHLQEAARIREEYRRFLVKQTRKVLEEAIPEREFRTKDDGWGIRGQSDAWGLSDIVWASRIENGATRWGVNVYLCGIDPEQRELARKKLAEAGLKTPWVETWRGDRCDCWSTGDKECSRSESEQDLKQIATLLDPVIVRQSPVVSPSANR